MTMPASDIENLPFGSLSRPLAEEVLQSAEEAVLTNPASVNGMADQGLSFVSPAADAAGAHSPQVGKLARHVAQKPFLSAFLALAAGALLAAVVRSALQRRRH